MSDPTISISPEETEDLFARLEGLADELTEPQRALLEAIIKIARDITEADEQEGQGSFDAQFDAAFVPLASGTARLIMEYATNPPKPGIIVCNPTTTSSPAIIVRNPNEVLRPPPPDLDDDDD